MTDRHVHSRSRNFAAFRGLQENWSTCASALIVAASLMAPVGIQVAFSAPDEMTARPGLPSAERDPDRGAPVGAIQSGEVNGIDVDLARLLAWHACAHGQEFLSNGFDWGKPAPR